jgi:Dolichyl-phosphate-mannose-protein mannosyltransferase
MRPPDQSRELGPTGTADSFSKTLDKISGIAVRWGLLALVAYAVIRSLACSFLKPLWFDELLMRIVCRQPGVAGIWNALRDGVDAQPPLFYLIERSAAWLIPSEQIGYRLPSVLGLAGTLLFVYIFVKRRNSTLPALVCSLLVLITPLFTLYAAEARPYSLVTACIALAFVCYQRAPATSWVVGLFSSLFLASSLHYYAVLAVVPFMLAELTFACLERQVRYSVWAALILGTAPLAIYWPLLIQMKLLWAEHFHARPATLNAVSEAYGGNFRVESPWGSALAGIAVLTILFISSRHKEQLDEAKLSQPSSISELILVLGLVLLPIAGYIGAKMTHAPFQERYFLPTILGIIATLGYVLGRMKPHGVMAAGMVVLLAVSSQEFGVWSSRLRIYGTPTGQINLISHLSELVRHEDLPIVISDAGAYVEFASYAPPALRKRVFGLADPSSATIYAGTDTLDKLVLALRSHSAIGVQDFASFATVHSAFLLCSNGSRFDWWPARLVHDGHRLQLLAVQGQYKIYLVHMSD